MTRLYGKLSESGQACNSGQKELQFWQDMVVGPVKEAIEMLRNDPVVVDANSGCELSLSMEKWRVDDDECI